MKKELSHKEYRRKRHKRNVENILLPIFISAIVLVFLVFLLDYISLDIRTTLGSSALIFSSFASSAFILFLMPYSKAAKRTRFIKSYILAALVGYGGFVLGGYLNFYLVIGLSFFVVSLLLFETDSEHPPALGITMAFLLFRVPFSGILIVLLGVVILVVAKTLLQTIGIAVKSGTIHIR